MPFLKDIFMESSCKIICLIKIEVKFKRKQSNELMCLQKSHLISRIIQCHYCPIKAKYIHPYQIKTETFAPPIFFLTQSFLDMQKRNQTSKSVIFIQLEVKKQRQNLFLQSEFAKQISAYLPRQFLVEGFRTPKNVRDKFATKKAIFK